MLFSVNTLSEDTELAAVYEVALRGIVRIEIVKGVKNEQTLIRNAVYSDLGPCARAELI